MNMAHGLQRYTTKWLAAVAILAVIAACALCVGNAYAADPVATDGGAIEAASVGSDLQTQAAAPSVYYRVKYGKWEGWAKNGSVSGKSTGKAFIGTAMKIKGVSGSVKYKTKGVGGSWQGAKANGKPSGSKSWRKGVEALAIGLSGKASKKYNVFYRVRIAGTGWQTWRMNGQVAGIEGKGARIVSMEVKLVKKSAKSFKARTGKVYVYNVTNGGELSSAMSGNKMKVVNIKKNITVPDDIHVSSNTVVNAKGKKVVFSNNGAGFFINEPTKTNYKDLVNFTIIGGTWQNSNIKAANANGHSPIRLAHASNIELLDFTIKDGYENHAIELIGCKNVVVSKVKLLPQGGCASDATCDQLQIDLADPTAAPNLSRKVTNGAPCKNVFVYGCAVKGARGIGTNWAYAEPNNCRPKNFHSGIVIKKCKIVGKTSEALSIFNCVSASVSDCDITTEAPLSRDAYSVGLHVAYQSDEVNGPDAKSSYKITIKDNKIKGGRQAIHVYSHNDAKFGPVTITGNEVYCKNGADSAINASEDQTLSLDVSDNDENDW